MQFLKVKELQFFWDGGSIKIPWRTGAAGDHLAIPHLKHHDHERMMWKININISNHLFLCFSPLGSIN